jgi:hypothetical protein
MDDMHVVYCKECIKDHEERLRRIEANNKEQAKLYYEREKLDMKIDNLEKSIDFRLTPLEKWMDLRVSQIASERGNKKESKSDFFSIAALCISIGSFIILVWKVL